MSVEAIRPAPSLQTKVYDPSHVRELQLLRETLQRSFPNMEAEKLEQSLALAVKSVGVRSNNVEIISLARMYLSNGERGAAVGYTVPPALSEVV